MTRTGCTELNQNLEATWDTHSAVGEESGGAPAVNLCPAFLSQVSVVMCAIDKVQLIIIN